MTRPLRLRLKPFRDHAGLHRGVIAVAPALWASFAVFLHPAWGSVGFAIHAATCLPRRAHAKLLLVASFPLLALWFAMREPFVTLPDIPFHRTFAEDKKPAERRGVVANIPVPGARGYTFLFHETRENGNGGGKGTGLRYRVSLEIPAGSEPPRWGSSLVLTGIAAPADPPLNPGQLDMRRVLRGQGADAALRAATWRELRPPPLWKTALMDARIALNASFERHVPRAALPLLEASLLNNTTRVPADTQQAFFRSGMQHILAISGQHIGLLIGFLLLVSLCARLPRKFAFGIAALLTAAYIPMVGAPVSVVRSGIMLACLLPAVFLERPSAGLHALGLTAAADLLLDPHNILNLGFQLSYAATLALILGSRPAQVLARKITEGLSRISGRGWARVFSRRPSPDPEHEHGKTRARGKREAPGMLRNLCAAAVQMILLSALITLFTYPVLAASTHTTTPWGVLGNVATVPVGAAMLIGGLCVWSLDFLLPVPLDTAAAWAGAATGLCALLLEGIVFLLARLPGALRSIADPPTAWLAALAAGCACTTLLLRRERFPAAILCGAVTLAAEAARPALTRLWEGGPRITFLAVGHGDAIVLELPGAVVLIDAGESPRIARNILIPFLQYRGITRLDLVLITHPHLDHYGGVAALLDAVSIGKILGPPEAAGASDPSSPSYSPAWQCLHAKARAHGVAWREARAGQWIHTGKGTSFWVLSPGTSLAEEDLNNRSLVTLLRTPSGNVLFTGDIEQPAQHALGESWPLWRGAWLKVPHHGSQRTTDPCFLRAVAPGRAVVSCGARFRFPGPRTLETLAAAGSDIAVTKDHGAVTWSFGRDGPREIRHLSRHRTGLP
jgi:competence protein ComEC